MKIWMHCFVIIMVGVRNVKTHYLILARESRAMGRVSITTQTHKKLNKANMDLLLKGGMI